jgi:hypothetical protein
MLLFTRHTVFFVLAYFLTIRITGVAFLFFFSNFLSLCRLLAVLSNRADLLRCPFFAPTLFLLRRSHIFFSIQSEPILFLSIKIDLLGVFWLPRISGFLGCSVWSKWRFILKLFYSIWLSRLPGRSFTVFKLGLLPIFKLIVFVLCVSGSSRHERCFGCIFCLFSSG